MRSSHSRERPRSPRSPQHHAPDLVQLTCGPGGVFIPPARPPGKGWPAIRDHPEPPAQPPIRGVTNGGAAPSGCRQAEEAGQINDGEVAGRSIAHLHIHVIPRWHGDLPNPRRHPPPVPPLRRRTRPSRSNHGPAERCRLTFDVTGWRIRAQRVPPPSRPGPHRSESL
ncbi:HIT domain-containing protein [Nocardia amikacinitolerans]